MMCGVMIDGVIGKRMRVTLPITLTPKTPSPPRSVGRRRPTLAPWIARQTRSGVEQHVEDA